MKVKYKGSFNRKPQSNFTLYCTYDVCEVDACGDYWVYDDEGDWNCLLKDEAQPIDTIVESVIKQFKERSEVGIKKYGVTLDRDDLSAADWILHTQQELMDGILYLEKLKQTL